MAAARRAVDDMAGVWQVAEGMEVEAAAVEGTEGVVVVEEHQAVPQVVEVVRQACSTE